MPLYLLAILAVVQGITEFLPISSSGHLVITWKAFDALGHTGMEQTAEERLDLDIAVHVGTLAAVCLYLAGDLWRMLLGAVMPRNAKGRAGRRLIGHVILASIPVVVVGYYLKDSISPQLRSLEVIAWATIGFGVLLYIADRFALRVRRVQDMNLSQALIIGLAQVLALIPGTSRAGITMTAARMLGYERTEAARFSLLLAIPAISGAGVLVGHDLYQTGNLSLGIDAAIAAGLSFLTALIAIALMMRWLRHASFGPFAVYRVFLGAVLLWFVYQ